MTNVHPDPTADNSPRYEYHSTLVDGYKCPKCRYPADAQRNERVQIHPERGVRETIGIFGFCLRPGCGWEGELH